MVAKRVVDADNKTNGVLSVPGIRMPPPPPFSSAFDFILRYCRANLSVRRANLLSPPFIFNGQTLSPFTRLDRTPDRLQRDRAVRCPMRRVDRELPRRKR